MSVLSPKADIRQRGWYVRYVPEADVAFLAYRAFNGLTATPATSLQNSHDLPRSEVAALISIA